MREDDILYFRQRAAEERQRALDCPDQGIASVHRRMAEHYERALSEGEISALRLVKG